MPAAGHSVSLLRTPYPYRCMLAICSDLDETDNGDVYFNTMDYLNTSVETPYGRGIGLETGNTMYFYMPPDQFAYWNGDEGEQARVRDMMQSGHIDCFHSFGDLATKRSEVADTLQHLDGHNCKMRTWIDHAIAPSNFGGDIMQGYGDVSSAPVYHADLTIQFGVEYVWTGRVSSMRGQDAPVSFLGIFSRESPLKSMNTLGKEAVKVLLGNLGNPKYSFHAHNKLIRDANLRDGQPVTEFMRSNPHIEGVSVGDTSEGLGAALSDSFLDQLSRRGGRVIVYTHLGKKIDSQTGFASGTRSALEKLKAREQSGEVLVTTTTRMLDFARTRQDLTWLVQERDDVCRIVVTSGSRASALDGLGFEVDSGRQYEMTVDGQPVATTRFRDVSSGRDVLSVPWERLEYPG